MRPTSSKMAIDVPTPTAAFAPALRPELPLESVLIGSLAARPVAEGVVDVLVGSGARGENVANELVRSLTTLKSSPLMVGDLA